MPATDSCSPVMVSIVLPVFNVDKYIDACLRSIIEQKFSKSYQAILVDDCSTDSSLKICQQYVKQLPKIFQLIESPKNAGVSVARNRGLEKSTGKYFMYVDPDDVLPATALAVLFDAAEKYNADIVKGNLVLFDSKSEKPARDQVKKMSVIRDDAILTMLYKHNKLRGHVAGKLMRWSRFKNIRFTPEVRMAQDLLYYSEVFSQAKTLVLIDQPVYSYRKHSGGSTGGKYIRGSYVDWLESVENTGRFAKTDEQRQAHKSLQIRTLAQIARECRKIPASNAVDVFQTLLYWQQRWDIHFYRVVFRHRPGFQSIVHFLKMVLAFRQIRKKIAQAEV